MFPKSILDDLGPLAGTATAPRLVRASDNLVYVAKDDQAGSGLHVRAAEFIWLSICRAISLPAPQPEILMHPAGHEVLGTRYETSLQQAQLLTGKLLRGGNYLSRIYAFDVFCANWDRHTGNYLVLDDGVGELVVFAIDFSHVTIHPGLCDQSRDPLQSVGNATRGMFPQVILPYGSDRTAALDVVDRLAKIQAADVDQILTRMPKDWLTVGERTAVSDWWQSPCRQCRLDATMRGLQNGPLL